MTFLHFAARAPTILKSASGGCTLLDCRLLALFHETLIEGPLERFDGGAAGSGNEREQEEQHRFGGHVLLIVPKDR